MPESFNTNHPMEKQFWLRIQNNYPKALKTCLKYFKTLYPDDWRQEIQSRQRLQKFFDQQSIDIELLWKYSNTGEKTYGYRIKSYYYQIQLHYQYSQPEVTYFNAFDWSFKILEFQIKKKEVRNPPMIFNKKRPNRRK